MGPRATGMYPGTRMRRMRRDPFSRRLARETRLSADDLIQPVFVIEGSGRREPVASMPGIERVSADLLVAEAGRLAALGIPAVALFPVPDPQTKSEDGREAWNPHGLVQRREGLPRGRGRRLPVRCAGERGGRRAWRGGCGIRRFARGGSASADGTRRPARGRDRVAGGQGAQFAPSRASTARCFSRITVRSSQGTICRPLSTRSRSWKKPPG